MLSLTDFVGGVFNLSLDVYLPKTYFLLLEQAAYYNIWWLVLFLVERGGVLRLATDYSFFLLL